MSSPLIRIFLPILFASFAFAQTTSVDSARNSDTLATKHDPTVQVPKNKVKKVKQPKVTDQAKKLKPQSSCPVLGSPINKSIYVDYQGKRIYLCCTDCIDSVKKNPEKYLKKIEKAGQSVEIIDTGKAKQAQPFSDKPSDSKGSGMSNMKM